MNTLSKREKIAGFLLFFGAFAINLKYILFDFGIDGSYQVTMAYRMALGDKLFLDMWEPHQMSAFLCAGAVWLYHFLMGSEGVVLFLQVLGVVLDAFVALFLYFVMKKYLKAEREGFLLALLLFILSPKDMPLPEFANMEVWFSILLFLSLYMYGKKEGRKKTVWLVLSAVFQCGLILSYPSCILVYLGVGGYFLKKKEVRSFLWYSGICLLFGGAYVAGIFRHLSPIELLQTLQNILALEASHSSGLLLRLLEDARDLAVFGLICAGLAGIYLLGSRLLNKSVRRGDLSADRAEGVLEALFFALILLSGYGFYVTFFEYTYARYEYTAAFIPLLAAGFFASHRLREEEREFIRLGMGISLLTLLSTLVLTDLELTASLPYLQLAVLLCSYACLKYSKTLDRKKWAAKITRIAVAVFFLMLITRGIVLIRPMQGHCNPIWEIGGRVKQGPAKYLMSTYMGPYMQNSSYEEWEEFIEDGQAIYLVSYELDTLPYLYKDTVIAAPTVMSTPTYNETILQYWESHPEKYPDVVIVECWYGELRGGLEESWILEWIREEYCPSKIVDGKFWRYYYR